MRRWLDQRCQEWDHTQEGLNPGMDFPGGAVSKESACNVGDLSLIPGSGRSPGDGNGNPLQYSFLENPQGQRSLAGCSPWGCKESDMTKHSTTRTCFFAGVTVHPTPCGIYRCGFKMSSTLWTSFTPVGLERRKEKHQNEELKLSFGLRQTAWVHIRESAQPQLRLQMVRMLASIQRSLPTVYSDIT